MNMLRGCLIVCAAFAFGSGVSTADCYHGICELNKMKPDKPLDERFTHPPADARILKIVHGLPDAPGAQDALFQSLKEQGFGGIVTNVAFEQYMKSEDKWAAFLRGVNESAKLGMAMWLYDECGYPSGAAGGITMEGHPEYEAEGLLTVDAKSGGGAVAIDLPPGELFRAVAVPVKDGALVLNESVDAASSVHDGKLAWDAPAGSWRVFVFTKSYLYEGTHAAVSLAYKLPYVNLISPEPTARFIEVTHGEYARRLGDDLGRRFIATFTDEPSLMSVFMRPQPYSVLPWGPHVSAEFERRCGYAIERGLPALCADAGPEGRRFRYDFWRTVGELVSENFFGQIQTWCHEHKIRSGGHLLCEESLLDSVPLYGNFFQCARRLDAPSIDCLTSIPSEVPWHIARLISSAAELEGRAVTMCETSDHSQRYRPEGDKRPVRDVSEAEIRGTCNRLMVSGINTITSYYSFAGLNKEQMNRLNDWIGRCCTTLRGGHQVADIALVRPTETAWVRFTPSRHWTHDAPVEAHRVDKIYRDAGDSLFRAGRDFTYADAQALLDAKPGEGVLKHGDLCWRVVILPDTDTLPLDAWETLERFYRSGGVVIALTSLPANSDKEFPAPRVQEIAKELFGDGAAGVSTNEAGGVAVFLPPGSEALLTLMLNAIIEPDGHAASKDAPLRVTHRRIDGREIYFVINDGAQAWEGDFVLPGKGEIEQCNPATGAITPLSSAADVHLNLEPFGGMLFRFKEAVAPRRLEVKAGGLPGLTAYPLPEAAPVAANGEFVTASIEPDPALGGWRASGTITKANVDTFLFSVFNYPAPVDVHDATYLSLDLWLPEAQKANVPMLVILRDTGGLEFCAETGVPLNAAGHACCNIPMNRFQRAGWRPMPDRALDSANIAAISVGWGGYFGAENENVTFRFSPPRIAR